MTDKELMQELTNQPTDIYKDMSDEKLKEIFSFGAGYKEFLNNAKTEREAFDVSLKMAQDNGFAPFEPNKKLKSGDKIYLTNKDKNVMLVHVGSESIENGVSLIGSHIDAPRIDLKQNPLYQDSYMAFFKTHYYGGIKKYQWTALPLSLHGVIYKKDGEKVTINIGEGEDDPVFCITDLLPHLAMEQMKKTMSEAIIGEGLNILIGGISVGDDEIKEKVKFGVLKLLNQVYGICERDFLTAELELVPAIRARDVGFDGAFVGGYGQDDRVCAYTSLKAIFDIQNPKKTAICLLVDKEEVGSMGNTGMKSRFFEMGLASVIKGINGECDITTLNKVLENSACLSADVMAGFDPNYPTVFDKSNNAYLSKGVVLTKYTGSRGKSGSSDASAEFIYKISKIFDDANVVWQTSELGKVDQGGGGTIAQYVANLNVEVVDCGVAILSMHSPFEISAKVDIYMAYSGYKAFYEN